MPKPDQNITFRLVADLAGALPITGDACFVGVGTDGSRTFVSVHYHEITHS